MYLKFDGFRLYVVLRDKKAFITCSNLGNYRLKIVTKEMKCKISNNEGATGCAMLQLEVESKS